jgi:hypothetical protein
MKATKLDKVLDFLKYVMVHFEKNKAEGLIWAAGLSGGFMAWAIGCNAEKINLFAQNIQNLIK